MAYISKVTLPSGQTYDIKDAEARELIQALGSPTHFAGETTSDLSDGSITNPITVGGENYTAHAGDIVVHGNREYIFDGTKWIELGDLTGMGNLAEHDLDDIVPTVTPTKDNVLGEATTFTNAASTVTFDSAAGSDFVTGYNDDAVAPSFVEGSFDAGTLPSFTEGEFSAGTLP